MKKIFQLLVLIGIFAGFTGCKFEEENIFDDSSANRIEKAKKEYAQLLCSAPNGWVMEYFPTDDQIGYTFLMKFFETGEVKILSKNKLTNNKLVKDSCLFEFTSINGPVLTFNSYSEKNTFHILSTPEDISSTEDSEQGIGYGGDFEFTVMKTEENRILLKGLKRKVYIPLTKLPEDQNWDDYFKLLEDMDASIFSANVPQLQLTVNDSVFTLTGGTSRIFKIVPAGGDPITDGEDMPFIVTDYGIRFVKPFEASDLSVQTFKLNGDKNALIEADNTSVRIVPESISDFLIKTSSKYFATKDNLNGVFSIIFDKLSEEFVSAYNGRRNLVSFGFSKEEDNFYFLLKTVTNEATFHVPYTIDNNTITIEPFDGNNMSNTDMNTNARLFYAAVPSIKEILNDIQGTYVLTSEVPFVLSSIKYTKKENEADYLITKR